MRDANGKIYAQHDKAFQDISAWCVMKGAERVATIAVKMTGRRSPNGLTCTAYVHVIGLPMTKGIARGGGYDMRTAAIAKAANVTMRAAATEQGEESVVGCVAQDFRSLVDQGHDIPHQLRAMGYECFQVV